MVMLKRLLGMKKEHLQRIFVINDPVFVSLILKMTYVLKKLKHNAFAMREKDWRDHFVSDKDLVVSSYLDLIYSIKRNSPYGQNSFGLSNEFENKIKKRENIILKKVRIFKKEFVYDSISFSPDFISSIEDLLITFDIGNT